MKQFIRMIALGVVPAVLLLSMGCETMQEHKIASGAVIGTATGAAAGAAIGGSEHRTEGALIGAAAGAALGTGVGYYLDRRAKRFERISEVEVEKVPETTTEPAPPVIPGEEPARVETIPPHITLRLDSEILFERDSSALKAGGIAKLQEIADAINEDPESRVLVKGFTSSEGSDRHNLQLSRDRADVVKNQLVAGGVASSRIEALGFGESNPIGDNATEAGRARNRRVEIEVIPPANAGQRRSAPQEPR